jgi:hypothetical protein
MVRAIQLTVLLCSLFFIQSKAFSQSKDVKAIIALMRTEEEVWNKGDIEGYVNLYAPHDSTRMIYGSGATYGKDSILAFYKKYWPKERMGHLTLTHDSIEKISRKFYYVSGFFSVLSPAGKTVKGRFSGLVKKIKGKWYLYTDHSA